jgi:hypothetical protein
MQNKGKSSRKTPENMAERRVVITNGGWLNSQPLPHTRPFMVQKVFDLAREGTWDIQLAGYHWK